jgi:hypothetical protein
MTNEIGSNETVSITFPEDAKHVLWRRTLSAVNQLQYELTTDGVLITKEHSLTIDAPSDEIRVGPVIEVPTGPIIVAGIGALSAVLGAILTFISRMKEGRVVIKGKDGATVEVPKDVSREDLEYYISKAKELGASEIELFGTFEK